MDVQLELSHRQAKSLFGALLDQELPEPESARLSAHLNACVPCRETYQKYARAVNLVRGLPREQAPASLSTVVMTRIRRRRPFGARGLALAHAHYRVPVEILIPILLAAAVGALVFFLSNGVH